MNPTKKNVKNQKNTIVASDGGYIRFNNRYIEGLLIHHTTKKKMVPFAMKNLALFCEIVALDLAAVRRAIRDAIKGGKDTVTFEHWVFTWAYEGDIRKMLESHGVKTAPTRGNVHGRICTKIEDWPKKEQKFATLLLTFTAR
jgi:hypothetical protein